ncbi:MAG: DUF4399 domain-containing protein [Gammaproteobacteria bacterium]|nr:DUF4399 domain-containing protein [Pseudomonadales bacterium]MCP5346488.1 DUF4399 domain-containing protein [Pseudomonadales bacterium]
MSRLSKTAMTLGAAMLVVFAAEAQMNRSPSPEQARVYIMAPADGAVVPSTFVVEFGLSGMGVAPAGMERANTGHHHLLVDGVELPDLNSPLGDAVMHFGGGQTQTRLTLPPGEHTLQLFFADYLHVPHNPPLVSEPITVTVVDD